MSSELPTVGHDVGLAATRFHRTMRHGVQVALEPFGLSHTEYGALDFVNRYAGSSNADLARFLLTTPQALGRVTARLRDANFLIQGTSDSDGRRLPLSLTPASIEALRKAQPAVENAQLELLSPLTTDEQVAFLRALERGTPSSDRHWKDTP